MGLFNESLHPRGKGAQGGQFVAKGASGQNDTVGYDANRGTGAGYGAKGGDARVKTLQSALNNLGFTDSAGKKLAVDGKLGPKTTTAIKALQRKLGMKADGLVTPALLKAIQHRAHQNHVNHANHSARKKTVAKKATAATHHAASHHSAPARKAPTKQQAAATAAHNNHARHESHVSHKTSTLVKKGLN